MTDTCGARSRVFEPLRGEPRVVFRHNVTIAKIWLICDQPPSMIDKVVEVYCWKRNIWKKYLIFLEIYFWNKIFFGGRGHLIYVSSCGIYMYIYFDILNVYLLPQANG